MTTPLISVIVPVYNAESTLIRCVDSILAQTFTDFELLLIDDGSKDRSGEICDGYAAKDSRVKVFHKPNGGVSSARNLGLDNARGEWISFVDSDDDIHKDCLYELNSLEANDFKVCNFDGDGSKRFESYPSDSHLSGDSIKFMLDNNLVYTPWGKLFKSSIIKALGLRFDTKLRLGEDTVFCWEYLLHCSDAAVSDKGLYFYTGRWGGGKKYGLSNEELIYNLTRSWEAIHALGMKFHFKTGVGIDKGVGMLLTYGRNGKEFSRSLMDTVRSQYEKNLDCVESLGRKGRLLLTLVKFRMFNLAQILLWWVDAVSALGTNRRKNG